MREREGSAWLPQHQVPTTTAGLGEMLPEPIAKRACAGGPARATGDLLSALPDGVLHIILSFLPAWHAVQTSVLSRRWRDLWCSMPYINIDEREFKVGAYHRIKDKWDEFVDFTTNLLLFHRNSVYLDKFRIYAHGSSPQFVDRWIRLGIKYCPSMLDIDIPYYVDDLPFKFPHLGSSLSRLKRLSVSNVRLDSHFAELLGSGCPALEDLELTCCFTYFRDTVRKLVLNTCYDLDYAGAERPMLITAPNLESLELTIPGAAFQNSISVCNATLLIKASVYIQYYEYFPMKNQRSLLHGLFNVTSLELTHFKTMVHLLDMLSASFGSLF